MGVIKSAAEIAKEKLAQIGEPTEEERFKWKYGPEGEKLAASYLRQDISLANEVKKYEDKAKKFIIAGINDILIRNISLPRTEAARKTNKKAMDGIKALKSDKVGVENVYSKIRNIFNHYVEQGERQRKQSYASLKAEFEAKVREALQQQLGLPVGIKIDVESQPQFQEEWHRLKNQLDSQYLKLLEECKQALSGIA